MIYLTCGHELKTKSNESIDKALIRVSYYWDSEDREGNKAEAYGVLCNDCKKGYKARKYSKYSIKNNV